MTPPPVTIIGVRKLPHLKMSVVGVCEVGVGVLREGLGGDLGGVYRHVL